MNFEHEMIDKSTIVLKLYGRLDTSNAPLMDRKLKQWGNDITELILDFSGLEYISSMGLRILLQAKKTFNDEGRNLSIRNMSESIREVFELTGFLRLMVNEEKFVVIRKDDNNSVILSLNGQMEAENIKTVSEELSTIANQKSNKPVDAVILDIKNLSFISPEAVTLLKQVIAETGLDKKTLSVTNASADIQAELGDLIAG